MAKITDAGLALIAQLQANSELLVIDKFIYANIDGLDPSTEPSGTEVKPDAANIVRESDINTAGYLDPNTVTYSDVLASDIGDFSFNWIGLFCSAHNTLIAVAYVPLQYKRATAGFNMGYSICKNFSINYTDIQNITGIVIDAATWQQDYSNLYEALGTVAAHEAAADPHSQYLQSIPGKTVMAYGFVSAIGERLSGSANWSVAKNRTGEYQLNITDAGDYLVLCSVDKQNWGETASPEHDQTTGIFNNNNDSNVVTTSHTLTGFTYSDMSWAFIAIKL